MEVYLSSPLQWSSTVATLPDFKPIRKRRYSENLVISEYSNHNCMIVIYIYYYFMSTPKIKKIVVNFTIYYIGVHLKFA